MQKNKRIRSEAKTGKTGQNWEKVGDLHFRFYYGNNRNVKTVKAAGGGRMDIS